jgi:hypothetical protein
MLQTLFYLMVGHAVADYPLQSDFMAREKNPWAKLDMSRVPPGQLPNVFWPWVMTAHALVHGGAVALITGSVWLGLAETACHWLIDLAKCAGYTDIYGDQCLHIACKVVWFLILYTCNCG